MAANAFCVTQLGRDSTAMLSTSWRRISVSRRGDIAHGSVSAAGWLAAAVANVSSRWRPQWRLSWLVHRGASARRLTVQPLVTDWRRDVVTLAVLLPSVTCVQWRGPVFVGVSE